MYDFIHELQLPLQTLTRNLVGMLQVVLNVLFQARYSSIVQHDRSADVHIKY